MLIFFDVDTQNDFMNKDGALYVPGAEDIKPNLNRLTVGAIENDIPLFGSVDAHSENDPEFKVFPRHCVKDTKGFEKIPIIGVSYITDEIPYYSVPSNPEDDSYAGMVCLGLPILIEKQTIDVFSNPHTENILKLKEVTEAVVYGVATDYCVKAAVLGMLKRGIKVKVVVDAIAAVNVKPTDNFDAIKEMLDAGAEFVDTDYILKEIQRETE